MESVPICHFNLPPQSRRITAAPCHSVIVCGVSYFKDEQINIRVQMVSVC